MRKLKIVLVVGARPNFMKAAPICRELGKVKSIEVMLVHTGQHYDHEMSETFFQELGIPEPDVNLGVGSGSHAFQTAEIMKRFEAVLLKNAPDLVIVVGDVNSTIACALVAAKLRIKVAHVEAGLRSFDRSMPEEINRILTDAISDYLFTSCIEANHNLKREGIPANKIFFVGNVMIDTLCYELRKIKKGNPGDYAVLTLHRPSNVDDKITLQGIISGLNKIAEYLTIYFPAHPRTVKQIKKFRLELHENIKIMKPLGYVELLELYMYSRFVLTDSGGLQEEASYMGIPCLTLRNNTERRITVTHGTNILTGPDPERIFEEARNIISGRIKRKKKLALWDGFTAKRITRIISKNKANLFNYGK